MIQIKTRSMDDIIDYLNLLNKEDTIVISNVQSVDLDDEFFEVVVNIPPMLVTPMLPFLNRDVYIHERHIETIKNFYDRDLDYQRDHLEHVSFPRVYLHPDTDHPSNNEIIQFGFGIYMIKPLYTAGVSRYSLSYI